MKNHQEANWVSDHPEALERHAGKWVAILDDEIVGIGTTAQEALDKARQKTDQTPFLIKAPRDDEGVYVL